MVISSSEPREYKVLLAKMDSPAFTEIRGPMVKMACQEGQASEVCRATAANKDLEVP